MVGMPHYTTTLLSSWTPLLSVANVYHPPPMKIPSQILSTMKINDNIAYAALPRELKGRRNVAAKGPRTDTGRFRSGKARGQQVNEITASNDLPIA